MIDGDALNDVEVHGVVAYTINRMREDGGVVWWGSMGQKNNRRHFGLVLKFRNWLR